MKKVVLLAFVLVLLSTSVFVGFMRPVVAEGTIYIRADGSVEGTDKIQRDVNVYTFTDNIINQSIIVERDNIIIDGAGYTLQGTGSGKGIDLTDRSGIEIKNLKINAFSYGIYLYGRSKYNNIIDNNITNNGYGIYLYMFSDYNTITRNNIINNMYGVHIEADNNNVFGNFIAANNNSGIWIVALSDHNNMDGNTITNNRDGIQIEGSYFNSIIGNNVTANLCGITLSGSYSHSNIILGNSMINNTYGIYSWGWASDNLIYHNNFVNNTHPAYNSESSMNVWDNGYPSGGNYWSNYTGTDSCSGPYQNETGSDGIGDTSHMIDANNTDRYPLMGPISFFNAGTWNEVTYYIHTVSNSTISDFHFSESEKLISFNVTGPDGTINFCRVTIPKELLWCDNPEQWEVWVNNTLIEDRKIMEDTNYTYIYFTYNQSTQNVEVIGVHVIPEFPTWASMLLILIVLTVAIAVYKRRLLKTPIQ